MTVWIAQCLCPRRHCILAAAAEAATREAAEIVAAQPVQNGVNDLVRDRVLNPWCGLCGAPQTEWRIELEETDISSIEEAMPRLALLQKLQMVTSAILGGHPGRGRLN